MRIPLSQKALQAFSLFLTFFTLTAHSAVKFDQTKLQNLQATTGEVKEWNLKDFLSDSGSGNLKFGANIAPNPTPLPKFLTISGNTLKSNPAIGQPGTYTFVLSAVDLDNSEFKDTNVPTKLVVAPPAPAFTINFKDLGTTPEKKPYSHDIKQYLETTQYIKSYSASNLPAWLSIDSSTGILSGTPERKDVGTYNFSAFATNEVGTAQLDLKITVTPVIVRPKWTGNPIDLGNVNEDDKFEKTLTGYVTNPEGFTLTYAIIDQTPPPWLQIGAQSGTLFGTAKTPKKYDVAVAFKYTLEGQEYSESTTFNVTVIHVNHAPYWITKPIAPPNPVTSGTNFTANLKNSAADPDPGDTLTFSMTGPAWGKLDPSTGAFTGVPTKANVGKNTFQVTVADQGGLKDTTELIIEVVKANEPPAWKDPIAFEVKEDSLFEVDLSDPKYVVDPDGDQPLAFSVMGTPPKWLKLSDTGILSGKPGKLDVGSNTITVKVSDNKSAPDDVTDIKILVIHVNHAPYWTLNPINSTATEDKLWKLDLTPWAKDDDLGDKLSFSAIEGPKWAQLSDKGIFAGTPSAKDVGTSTWTVRVSDGLATADVKVIVDVQHVNHPPVWKQPTILANSKEGQAYTGSLKDFVTDPDPNDEISFVKVSQKPGWLFVGKDGSLSGTPGAKDVGTITFEVDASDLAGAHAIGKVTITVESVNHPPYWRNAPAVLVMTDAFEDKSYKFSLVDYAADPDPNDTLTFSAVSVPTWMFVGQKGDVAGVPTKDDLGTKTLKLRVTDQGGLFADTDATIVVIHTNHPPVVSPIPTFVMNENEVKSFDLKNYISDLDGDTLNCTKLTADGPWAALSGDCVVTASPKRPQVQATPHSFDFKVDDKQLFANSTFRIQVNKVPVAPIWLSEPITASPLQGETGTVFTGNIASRAKDPNNEPLTFKLAEGSYPPWLVVGKEGSLSGKPLTTNEGINTFKLLACNTDLCSEAGTLLIKIKVATQTDTVQIDTKVPGAPSEYMWDIDNSDHCDQTIRALKQNIGVFFDRLSKAELHHYGIVLSSDVKEFGAEPIRDKASGESMLLKWDATGLAASYKKRVDLAYSSGFCNNCNSSPIWAMFRFFERLPNDFSEIYQQNYFMPGVPSDSMMVSHQMDHYKYYTKNVGEPVKSYTPNDFAREFITVNRKAEKSFRVSAIAPECPSLLETSGDPTSAGPSNAYQVVVSKTGGKYYTTKCEFNAIKTLNDWADSIIFRAYVHAKQRIKLTKTPTNVSSIKVRLAGVELTPPTGSDKDKWSYDAGTNEVVLKWYLIDEGQLKPGQKIEVEYRVD